MRSIKTVSMILAGGIGERLYPLTSNRCKPAVPFGGSFRIIDFTLMNCVHSGLRNVQVLTQYHTQSLSQHRSERWNFLSSELGEGIELVPPKMRAATGVYQGTADAIYRNLDILDRMRPDTVLILSGDHVYRADYQRFLDSHLEREADVSVLTGYVEPHEASSFGVVNIAPGGQIIRFVEKPADPTPFAVDGKCLINLGVYCFNTRFLVERLVADAKKKTSHDFGKNILPASVERGNVQSCPLEAICPDAKAYWRDVGSIDSYFDTSMDLLASPPGFSLIDPRWPRTSRFREWVPARYSTMARIDGRTVQGRNLVSSGVNIEGSQVVSSILSPRVSIGRGCELEECIIFPDAEIGEGTKLRRVIVEEGVKVPPHMKIGSDWESGEFTVSRGGVVVIGANRNHANAAYEPAAISTTGPSVLQEPLPDLEEAAHEVPMELLGSVH